MSAELMNINRRVVELQEQVIELQTRLLFQEDSLQALDDVIARQQKQIDDLTRYCQLLKEGIAASSNQDEGGDVAHELPPHY